MIIKKITEADVPRLRKFVELKDFCTDELLKKASVLKVLNYRPAYSPYSYRGSSERKPNVIPVIIMGQFEYTLTDTRRRNRTQTQLGDCEVHSLPSKLGDDVSDIKCTCRICGLYYQKQLCEHAVALLMELMKDIDNKFVLLEQMYPYENRLEHERCIKYCEGIRKYRSKCSDKLLPAKKFYDDMNISLLQEGIVYYDILGYVENCVTCKAAIDIAKEIACDSDFSWDLKVNYLRTRRTNEYSLEASLRTCGYPHYFTITCEMTGNRLTWKLPQFKEYPTNVSMGCIPYDYTPETLGGKPFLDEYQLVALSMLLNHIREHGSFQDSTDKNATEFFKRIEFFREAELDALDADTRSAQEEKKNLLELYPRIVTDSSDTTLGFKIGRAGERSYVVKNIQNLVYCYRRKEMFVLSKTAGIDFSNEDFTGESLRLFQFIIKRHDSIVNVTSDIASRRRDYLEPKVLAQMPFKGQDLDNFFDAAKGIQVEYEDNDSGIRGTLTVGADVPINFRLELNTTKDARGNISGISLTGVIPRIRNGAIDKYILDSKTLKKISGREVQLLKPFSDVADENGRFYLFVGRPNLSEFYYRVLPVLMENPFVDVVDNCEGLVDGFLSPEPVFEFFLDYDGSRVTLKLVVSYEDKSYTLTGSNNLDKCYHDYKQENRGIREVQRFFKNPAGNELWYREVDDDLLFSFISGNVERLERFGTVRGSAAFSNLKVRKTPSIRIGVSVDSNMLDISVTAEALDKNELLDVMNSYRLKKKWFRLRSGEFIDLADNEMLREISEFLDKIELVPADVIQKKAKLPLFRALYLDRLMQDHESLAMSRDNTYRRLVRSFNSIRDSDYEPADELKDVLREYQKHGFKWLETVKHAGFGGILADDMGLGKTLQMISVIKSAIDEGANKPSLIVCPASLVYNWAEEFARFTPDIRVCVMAGTLAVRKANLANLSDKDVLVTSYDLLTRDIALYQPLEFELLVIDEAQYIKNPKAGHSKAVKAVSAGVRFALTGTPIENRLSELWSIFDFVMPGFLYGYTDFNKKFEYPITRAQDPEATMKLKSMISPFILRRQKADVLKNLPAKIDEVRYTRISGEQQKLYDAQVMKMKQMIQMSGDSGEDKIRILAELTRIRQICCDPSLVFEGYAKESAKRDACMDLIETAIDGGHRMLVFSQFTSMLELLEKDLNDRKISYYKITGSTPKEKRITMVHEFNEGDTPVFLISLKAGGTGLNLVGADTVIHYDPWWNLAVQNQATDRAHRIGQTKNVTVYRLILKGTIEEKILTLQETKKDLAESILEGNNQSLMSLSSEELLALLS